MDTQVGNSPVTEGKWAVDQFLSHSGSGTNSIFKVKWASGDITWLPYYQVTHLQALTEYLNLVGVQKISQLPKGSGMPPLNNPQIFVGAISKTATDPDPLAFKNHCYHPVKKHCPFSNPPSLPLTSTRVHVRPTPNLSYTMPATHPSSLRGINHPLFTQISPTIYLIKQPDYPVHTSVHMAQITIYLQFDKHL